MPLDFPTAPAQDQLYTFQGITYQWNGYAWLPQPPTFPPPEPNSVLAVYWGDVTTGTIGPSGTLQVAFVDVPVKSPTSKLICLAGVTVEIYGGTVDLIWLDIVLAGTINIAQAATSSSAAQIVSSITTGGFHDHASAVGTVVNVRSSLRAGTTLTAVVSFPWLLVQEIEQ